MMSRIVARTCSRYASESVRENGLSFRDRCLAMHGRGIGMELTCL